MSVLNGDGSSRNSTYAFAGGNEIKSDGTAPSPGTTIATAIVPTGDGGDFGLRHLEGVNYAFADGHVKWLKSGTKTDLNKVLWNGFTRYTDSQGQPTFFSG